MKLPENRFLQNLREGRQQSGFWLSLASNISTEIVATSGFDWLLVDMEHAPTEVPTVIGQLQAIAPHGSTAIVRPPWNDAVMIKRLLDAGAQNLLIPMVQTVDEAKAAVAATRYPPDGIRGVAGSIRASQFGRVTDYHTQANANIGVIIQAETQAAVGIAGEMGSLDGVDGVFYGPADIGADMGLLGKTGAAEVWDLIRESAAELRAAGIRTGTLSTNPDQAAALLEEGFDFVACGLDSDVLAKGADALSARMRKAMGKD